MFCVLVICAMVLMTKFIGCVQIDNKNTHEYSMARLAIDVKNCPPKTEGIK